MDAFIAREKYIVKERKPGGIGVSVTKDEDVAKYESTRRKNVESYNSWLSITIPDRSFFLDVAKPVREQTDDVIACLGKKEFLTTLFTSEARRLYAGMDELVSGETSSEARLEKSNSIFAEFLAEKKDFVMAVPSGEELFALICGRCREHDAGKSSALLYNAGIKGTLFSDETGERILLYNAAKDIIVTGERSGQLQEAALTL